MKNTRKQRLVSKRLASLFLEDNIPQTSTKVPANSTRHNAYVEETSKDSHGHFQEPTQPLNLEIIPTKISADIDSEDENLRRLKSLDRIPINDGQRLDLLLQDFLDAKVAQRVSERTLENYTYTVGRFVENCGVEFIEQVTPKVIKRYVAGLHQVYKSESVRTHWSGIRTFFVYCTDEGDIEVDPMAKIKVPIWDKPLCEPLSDDEWNTIFNSIKGNTARAVRDRAFLSILVDCGLRLQECTDLNIGDIDKNVIRVQLGKGRQGRLVWMGKACQKNVDDWIKKLKSAEATKDDPLWISQKECTAMSKSGLSQILRRISHKVGIAFSAHDLRRTFATNMLRNGADLLSISKCLGHKNVGITERYISQTKEDLSGVQRKNSPLDNMKQTHKLKLSEM